jgi:outer membrane protein TolC
MKWCLVVFTLLISLAPLSAQEVGEELSLDQAIGLALKNNLSIEIATYNPQISDTSINIEKSKFEPLLTADINAENRNQPSGSTLFGAGTVNTKSQNYNFAFAQRLMTGTIYSLQFNNGKTETDQFFTSINPRFDTTLFANLTQPLLRNFGTQITKTPLMIAEKNRMASDYRLQQQVADVALEVEQSYWNLVFARGELDVVKRALSTAQTLYENNKKQVEVGTMAPLEVVTAEAEVALREEQIIRNETLIKNTEDLLRFQIYGRAATTQTIIPTDKPVVASFDTGEEDAIQTALAGNPDLKALQADLESSQLNTRLAQNQLKPQLDLRASLGGIGLGGDALVFGGDDPFNPIVIGTIPGGYTDSLSNVFNNRTFAIGVLFGLPIGNGAAKADYARADLLQKQSNSNLDRFRQALIQSVRAVVHNLQDNLKRLAAARASMTLQEKKLDAEQKKLDVGLSTNFVVLQFTQDLAQSQSDVLSAMVEYNKNKAQLKRFYGEIVK